MTRLFPTAILAALALQLNILGVMTPCEMGPGSHDVAAVAHAGTADHDAGHPAPVPAEHSDCDGATQTSCCLVSSCASIAGSVDVVVNPERTPDSSVATLASAAPLSRITTPDPPPPKT